MIAGKVIIANETVSRMRNAINKQQKQTLRRDQMQEMKIQTRLERNQYINIMMNFTEVVFAKECAWRHSLCIKQ
jgi:hypothetical protein